MMAEYDSKSDLKTVEDFLEKACRAGTYVVRMMEDNVKCGDDPSPHKKADWQGACAHAYAAMSFMEDAEAARAAMTRLKL